MPSVGTSANDNYTIRWASENEHSKIVKLLLATKDLRIDLNVRNRATNTSKGHYEIVKILTKDPRVKFSVSKKQYKMMKLFLLINPRICNKYISVCPFSEIYLLQILGLFQCLS